MADNIVYRLITEKDVDQVKQLLYDSFFVDEPLDISLGTKVPDECQVYVDCLLDSAVNTDEVVSLVAEVTSADGGKQVIGCRLSIVETRTKQFRVQLNPSNQNHVKMGKIIKFLNFLHGDVNVFDHYNVDKCLHFQALNVKKEYGGRGVGKRLIDDSIKLAQSRGIRLAIVEATSKFARRIYDKLNYDVLNEVKYQNYCDDNGKVVFDNTGVHLNAAFMGRLYDVTNDVIN